jgi:hypothetical protein
MSKRLFGRRPVSLAVTLGAALALTLTPALTRPSAAGNGPVYWPQPWPDQWQQQGPQPGTQQGPPTPEQWQQQWPQPGPPPSPPQAPPQWPPQGFELPSPPWSPQGYQAAPPPWPLGGPPQWEEQQWVLHPVGTLFSSLADIRPEDIAITDWNNGSLVLWRDYPVTLVDLRSVLDDDQIGALLDAIDSDPIAGDNADGLTGLLQDFRILPNDVGVVGADLLDGPPAFFVLPY